MNSNLSDSGYQIFFNRSFLMNMELTKVFLDKEKEKNEIILNKLTKKEKEIEEYKGQINTLEKVLILCCLCNNRIFFI